MPFLSSRGEQEKGATMAHNNARPAHRPYEDREWLRQKYHGENLLLKEIAEIVGVTSGTISYWLKKHRIRRRPGYETYQLKKQRKGS